MRSCLVAWTIVVGACGDSGSMVGDPGELGRDADATSISSDAAASIDGSTSRPSEPRFEGTGLPNDLPWGPGLLAVQSDEDASGAASDLAFGVFWNADAVVVDYRDDTCIGFRTELGSTVGRDVGDLVVEGGAGAASQALTRNDEGYYYLADDVDAWSEGDAVNLVGDGITAGPIDVPSPFVGTNVGTITEIERGRDLGLVFPLSDATHVSVSLSSQTASQRYLLACLRPILDGEWALPGAAIASIPAPVEEVELKVQPANAEQQSDFIFFAIGKSERVQLPLVR